MSGKEVYAVKPNNQKQLNNYNGAADCSLGESRRGRT
jgi:hypothetical protein